jgi:hypothetical protein
MKYPTPKNFLLLTLFLVSLINLNAVILSYDSFTAGTDQASSEYTSVADGNYRLTNGQNPAIAGFSGSWQSSGGTFLMGTTPAASLSYTDANGSSLSTAGNSIYSASVGMAYRSFDSNVIDFSTDNTYYISFLFQVTDVTKDARIVLGNGSAVDWPEPAIRINGSFSLQGGSSPGNRIIASVDTDTHLAVMKLNVNSAGTGHNVELYWDPILSSENANTVVNAGFENSRPTNLLLSSRNSSGEIRFDELRIGTTWDSVTEPNAIPEPSAYALMFGALSLGVVLLRRRQG